MPSPFVNLIRDFATQTTLALVKTAVDAINAKIPAAPATEGKQDTGNASLSSIDGKLPAALGAGGGVKVDGSGTALLVSAASLPLPAGAALDATLTGGTQIAIAKGAAATGAAVSGNPVYTAGIDGGGLARPTLHSAAGNAQVSIAKGTSYSSAAGESSAVVSASPCSPSMINVRNLNGTTRYVQFFDAGSLPANGTVPKFMFMLTANSDQQKTFPCAAGRFATAMTVASSSTAGTLTFSAGTDLLIQIDFYPSST